MAIPSPCTALEHESFDDAWEVALLDDSPRSLGRRALLDRYKPPKDDHDHDHRGDDDDKPGKGHDKDNDNKDKDKHKSKKSKGKKKDD